MQHSTETSESEVKIPEEFAKKCDLKTKALEVNGELLWVCPQILASKSPVFHRIFFGEYPDKESDIIPVKGKNLKDFVHFLQCLNASPEAFKSLIFTNYPAILKLADEFNVISLVEIIFSQLLLKFGQFKSDVGKHAVEILEIVTLAYHFKHQQTIDSFFPIYCQVPYKTFKENYDSLPPEVRELYLMNRADNQSGIICLRFVMENFSKFANQPKAKKELSGPLAYFGGFQWNILVEKMINSQDIHINLDNMVDRAWSCNCTTKLSKLLAQMDSVPDLTAEQHYSTRNMQCDNREQSFTLDEVMDPKNGYIKDDSIILEVELQTRSEKGFLLKESDMLVSSFVYKKVKNLFQKKH